MCGLHRVGSPLISSVYWTARGRKEWRPRLSVCGVGSPPPRCPRGQGQPSPSSAPGGRSGEERREKVTCPSTSCTPCPCHLPLHLLPGHPLRRQQSPEGPAPAAQAPPRRPGAAIRLFLAKPQPPGTRSRGEAAPAPPGAACGKRSIKPALPGPAPGGQPAGEAEPALGPSPAALPDTHTGTSCSPAPSPARAPPSLPTGRRASLPPGNTGVGSPGRFGER